jgi:molybdate-binding protein/DNA-binding transcriptional regulator YhcF (GntR family)
MDISFRPDEALYLQIADHFRRLVAAGKLHPGERLPAIRELAQKLAIDPGTVARAYQELERDGVVTGRRGGGSFVSNAVSEAYLTELQHRRLSSLVEGAILEALGLGFSTEEIETAFTVRLAEWRERRIESARSVPAIPQVPEEIRFIGSHDLAVELLATHFSALYPDLRFNTSFVGSLAGLMALESGEADIAGAHLMDAETGEYNVPYVRRLMPHEVVVLINLVQRVQGLMLPRGNPKHINGIADLKSPDVTFVNRQKGSGTRMLLDSQLLSLGISPDEVKGYEREEKTHVAVANAVVRGQADVGLGAQSAAMAASLDFIPLVKERYDLITLKETLNRPPFGRVLDVVREDGFKKMVSSLAGYDLSDTGTMVTVEPRQRPKS